MLNLLASVVEVTGGDEGGHVVIDPMGPMLMSGVYLFLLLSPLILILLFFFYKKKLQHQQILAAMEKGIPVKDLLVSPNEKEKGWILNISAGIGLLFVAIALAIAYYPAGIYEMKGNPGLVILVAIPLVIAGIGLSRLLRGIFQKAAAGKQPDPEVNAGTPPTVLPMQ